MTGAFNGSSAIKQELLGIFDAVGDAPVAISGLFILLKEAPVNANCAMAGYPETLARFLDRLIGSLAEGRSVEKRVEVRALARRCLADVSPGADLSAIPVQILAAMLQAVDRQANLLGAAPPLREVLMAVIDLQERRAKGVDVSKGEWAAIRERAVSLTDGFQCSTLRTAGQAVESAAWDLTMSGSVLIDILKPYLALIAREAVMAEGWTAHDGDRAETMLRGIYDETQAERDAGGDVSIPALFHARDPELSRRYKQYLGTQKSSGYTACRALLDKVLTLLACASVADREGVCA